jgi:hypothetical protein
MPANVAAQLELSTMRVLELASERRVPAPSRRRDCIMGGDDL